uniref:BEN domain-containing protein n=2 Tax=Sarcophilus harrisii TaxID=9305 RepID=G3VUH1_SARHA
MAEGAGERVALQGHFQPVDPGLGDGEPADAHPTFDLAETSLGGGPLCSPSFQQQQELELQEPPRQVPLECASVQARGILTLGRPAPPLLAPEEEAKNRKRPWSANGPSLGPPFPRGISVPDLPAAFFFPSGGSNSLDIRAGGLQDTPRFPRTQEPLRAARPTPAQLGPPPPVLSRLSTEPVEPLPSEGTCPWAAGGGKVTGLYAELVKELELQMAELRRLLVSREEAALRQERRIRELELENQQLKGQLRSLEEQNDLLSSTRGGEGVKEASPNSSLSAGSRSLDVNEGNIQFLKGLAWLLESNMALQANGLPAPLPTSPPVEPKGLPAEAPRSPPVCKLRVGLPSGFPAWLNSEDGVGSPATLSEATCLWEENVQDTLPDGTPVWASPVEENGRPKLELIPNSGVYITHHQLDDLSQVSTDKPKLMTRRMLDYFFSRETLARSSATGQRIAHNNTTMEKPIRLPVAVVNAIKEYVTKVCGRGCNFNAVINSKCGTSRRAVKKMIVKMETGKLEKECHGAAGRRKMKGQKVDRDALKTANTATGEEIKAGIFYNQFLKFLL